MSLDALALTAHLPEVDLAPGDIVVREGGTSSSLWILVSGQLACSRVTSSSTRSITRVR